MGSYPGGSGDNSGSHNVCPGYVSVYHVNAQSLNKQLKSLRNHGLQQHDVIAMTENLAGQQNIRAQSRVR